MIRFESPCPEPEQKLAWLRITIALGFICGFVLSWRLWVSSRLFPLVPVSDWLPVVPFPLDFIWFFLLLGLLALIIRAQSRWLILTYLTLAGLLSLWDQDRWQAWFYQYLFMLAGLGIYAWKKPAARNNQAALNVCRLIVICTYLWSGFQKLNVNFVRSTWPDVAGSFLRFLPAAFKSPPPVLILLIPLLEISIALGLATLKVRNMAVIFALLTHLFILIVLISSGENMVVWPWNIAMGLLVFILFWQDKKTSVRQIFSSQKVFHVIALILFGVLPALSFADLWDSYLSSALYSGNTDQAVILVSPSVIERLPAAIHPHIWQSSAPFFLDINRWAYGELNVPVYPEPRIYRKVTAEICADTGNSPDIKLRITTRPDALTGARSFQYYDCKHIYLPQ